jgi:hypothetical protein
MGGVHGLTNIIPLLEQVTITGTGEQTGVDCQSVNGEAIVIIGGSAIGASANQTYKLQHCTTIGGTYADTGYTFAITTTADRTAAWSQAITVNFDGLKQFITLYITEAGTSSSVVSCYILHRKNVT